MIEDSVPEDRGQALAVQEETQLAEPQQLNRALQELVALERERIDSTNRRTDVALRAIDASDAADKRQYDYHVEKMRKEVEERSERRRSVFRVLWAIGGWVSVVAALLLLMLFFGTDTQREVAMQLLSTALTGLGGAGILWLFRTVLERVARDSSAS